MSELFREIEEDIRRERIEKLWQNFGKVAVGISAGIVLATIVMVVYQNHRESVAMEKTAQVIKGVELINAEDYKGAIPLFTALAADENSSYYGLAMLRKAEAETGLGKPDEAKKTYEALAKHDAAFGTLGKLLDKETSASGDVIAQPDRKSALYYSQSEFRAWQLLQQGKKNEAVDQFAILAQDFEAPSTVRERAGEVLQHIAPEKLKETPQPKETSHE